MTTLLVAEHAEGVLKDATAKSLTAARALGADVHVVVAGRAVRPVADAAAELAGVQKVLLADHAIYEHMLAEPVATLIVSLATGYDAIVAPATTTGKNILPRVAALLDVMQVSDIVKVISADTFERLIYAGNALQTVRSKEFDQGDHRTYIHVSANRQGGHRSGRRNIRVVRSGYFHLCRGGIVEVRAARAHVRQDHHLGRTGNAEPRQLCQVY